MLSWEVSSRVEQLKALLYVIDSYEKTRNLISSLIKQSEQQGSEDILLGLMADEYGSEEMNEDEF